MKNSDRTLTPSGAQRPLLVEVLTDRLDDLGSADVLVEATPIGLAERDLASRW